jgi:GxxExxY protein
MLTNPAGANDLTGRIIGGGIRVHQQFGPGLLESVYSEALAFELRDQGLEVAARVWIPLVYRGRKLSSHYEVDLLVARTVIVEVKSVVALAPIHPVVDLPETNPAASRAADQLQRSGLEERREAGRAAER